MTRQEAITEACSIVALAYHSIGDYDYPSDGFCDKCSKLNLGTYQNKGDALEYVRKAVVEKLKRDGYVIATGFDSETGKENTNLLG